MLVIVLGWRFIDPANHTPYIPERHDVHRRRGRRAQLRRLLGHPGRGGHRVLRVHRLRRRLDRGAGERRTRSATCRSASSARSSICTVLYVLFAHVLTGIATVEDFRTQGREASVAFAISKYMPGYGWLSKLVTVAILGGFSSVILVMLIGQSRVFYLDGADGLVPRSSPTSTRRSARRRSRTSLFFVFVGLLRRVRPRGHRRRHDEHRDAVRVHPRLHRRLDHAREGARRAAPVPRPRRAGRRRSLGVIVNGAMISASAGRTGRASACGSSSASSSISPTAATTRSSPRADAAQYSARASTGHLHRAARGLRPGAPRACARAGAGAARTTARGCASASCSTSAGGATRASTTRPTPGCCALGASSGSPREYLEPATSEDREAAMRLFAARGFDLVIGVGFIFSNDVDRVARDFPAVRFACVDYARPAVRPPTQRRGPGLPRGGGVLPGRRRRRGA